ncbi:radiation-inducible immediate-early gene IEX-1 [Gadus macrocephalus]|uniref:radiation-inducible immediate-early gene IEX-1 n=1 Tax=Gadus macrocephalus TaxID=80720 RepID=UPI0028CBC048|nr:radiation-inducible immediate-early gene IEX-1 [Gadus macrocephalus]
MYSRSESLTMSVRTSCPETFAAVRTSYPETFASVRTSYPETFASQRATRSTQPEIFTFERIPAKAAAVRSYGPLRSKKRCTRVMYPAKVRMHLPPVERSAAKRCLLALCLVLLWQIYTEEPCADTPPGCADPQVLPLRSAEDQVRRLAEVDGFSSIQLPAGEAGSSAWLSLLSNGSGGETESDRSYDHSTRNGYMVALLVYHKLTDN